MSSARPNPQPLAFFVSSAGDTNLAKKTIAELIEQKVENPLFLIPLTKVAEDCTQDLVGNTALSRVLLKDILQPKEAVAALAGTPAKEEKLNPGALSAAELDQINAFAEDKQIARAYIGVPSNNQEASYQIAKRLQRKMIPCIIANEYLFKQEDHAFWGQIDDLVAEGCEFAVPLQSAGDAVLAVNKNAKIKVVGHLSLDQPVTPLDPEPTRAALKIGAEEKLVFISGTSAKSISTDNDFLEAVLKELSEGVAQGLYAGLQLRMGIHPGVENPDDYLKALLETCDKYPKVANQFQIILTDKFKTEKLTRPLPPSPFLLPANVAGPAAVNAAQQGAGQALAGASVNELAFQGRPSYVHQSQGLYLPKAWYSQSLSLFFTQKPRPPHSKSELGLTESAPRCMAKLMKGLG